MSEIVLITGASSGIGKAIALEHAKKGDSLYLLARREELLQTLQKECLSINSKIKVNYCVVDITQEDRLKISVEDCHKKFGRIDRVYVNAGFGVMGPMSKLTTDDFRNQFSTNFFGAHSTIAATLNYLKETKGRIALVGSVSSYLSLPLAGAYSASKYAVRALAETLYIESKIYGISCTLISPGFIESQIRHVNNEGQYDKSTKDPVPKWLIMPAEVAARKIVRAVDCRRREIILTLHGKMAVFFAKHFSGMIYFVMRLLNQKMKS